MVGNIFGPDLGIVLVIILRGPRWRSQLPKLARNVGTAGKEFRKAQQEAEEEAERERAAKIPRPSGCRSGPDRRPGRRHLLPATSP